MKLVILRTMTIFKMTKSKRKIMKNFLLFIFVQSLFIGNLLGQNYTGKIEYGNSIINYEIKLEKVGEQTRAFFTSINMNAYEIPCQQTTFKEGTLKFYVISDFFTYEYQYQIQKENFSGSLKVYSNESEQLLNTFATDLKQMNFNKEAAIEKKDVVFSSNGLQLYGTLWKPKNSIQKGMFFVTTSQGNDRSGSNAEAYYFANLGYTVFNYDKRGTGKSEGNWQLANIEELSSDDLNALSFFSKTSGLEIDEIGIKGSSQGGIKIPYILSKLPKLNFGISISCPDGTLLESDLNHWKNLNETQIGKKDFKKAFELQKVGYEYLAGKVSYDKVLKLQQKYKGAPWLKYVWIPESSVQKDAKLNFSGLPYFKKISQPILVVQGLSDEIIPLDSYKTIAKAIKKSKSPKHKVITLKNTSHSMTWLNKEFPYFQTLSPDYLSSVNDWLKGL